MKWAYDKRAKDQDIEGNKRILDESYFENLAHYTWWIKFCFVYIKSGLPGKKGTYW